MTNRFRAVVFDFDYTLADSSPGIIASVNFALQALGLPTASAEQVCPTIGLSLADTFLILAGPRQRALTEEFIRLYVQRADQIMVDMTVLFAPVPSTVARLKEQGLVLGICSTKYRYRIAAVLAREGLSGYFDALVGGEDVVTHKPDPGGLCLTIGRLGRSPERTLYVGDSVTDAETARRAGVSFVAVLSGVTPREHFRDYPVYRVLQDLSELPSLLQELESQG